MPTKVQQSTMQLYCGLMEEAKLRIAAIEGNLSGKTGLPGQIVRESCYLQLRLLCELIALAAPRFQPASG